MDEPDAEKVLKEINGYRVSPKSKVQSPNLEIENSREEVANFELLKGFDELKDDGTTASGCWIYCGVYPEHGRNRAASARMRRRKAASRKQVTRSKTRLRPLRTPHAAIRLGLGVACQSPHDVQPRQCRPRRKPVERAQTLHLVGCSPAKVDRLRYPRLPT